MMGGAPYGQDGPTNSLRRATGPGNIHVHPLEEPLTESDCLARRLEAKTFSVFFREVGQFIAEELERALEVSDLPYVGFKLGCTPSWPIGRDLPNCLLRLHVTVTEVDAIVLNPAHVQKLACLEPTALARYRYSDEDFEDAHFADTPRHSVVGREILASIREFIGTLVDGQTFGLGISSHSLVDYDQALIATQAKAILAISAPRC